MDYYKIVMVSIFIRDKMTDTKLMKFFYETCKGNDDKVERKDAVQFTEEFYCFLNPYMSV